MTCTPQALRQLAVQRDSEAAGPFRLGELWQRLCHGAWIFHDTFSTDERHFALVRGCLGAPRPLDMRKLQMLESVLLGKSPKVVAFDSQRCLSSITTSMQDCVRSMGLTGRFSQAPVLLTMAARALHRPESAPKLARLSDLRIDGELFEVVSARRPDLHLPVRLSLAETAVLRRLVAGDSHAEISDARATSPRTVANQLATAFRKLGVSGRRATLERLIQHSAQQE
jgi:DNA-binding CsgD family transcriptional regulator